MVKRTECAKIYALHNNLRMVLQKIIRGDTQELMNEGHSQKEAPQVLLTLIQTGVLQAESEDFKEYEREIEAVLKGLLRETN